MCPPPKKVSDEVIVGMCHSNHIIMSKWILTNNGMTL